MIKMLKNTRFIFNLEVIDNNQTRVINQTYYKPANFFASVLNVLMMRRMISKAQEQILINIKSLAEG
jgi:hypothetical protein